MSPSPSPSRRAVLRALGGAPLFPVAGVAASLLQGCAGGATSAAAPLSAEFVGMPAPTSAAARATTTVESGMVVRYANGARQDFRLAYRPLFMTGDRVPDGAGGSVIAGGYYDIAGRPILDHAAAQPVQFYSDCPDGYSLLALPGASAPGAKGNTLFAVVQFEYTSRDAKDAKMYGKLPSQIAVLTLDQDRATGELKLLAYRTVDPAAAHGLWITCGASLSPWNSHLSSEEYEPDAVTIASNERFRAFSRNLYGDPDKARPYHYGHLPEVTVAADGRGTLRKHYCLGRISHELVQVMPDRRTVLMGDDATNGGLFAFVADRAEDLSAGTLYVAKVAQRAGAALDAGGEFDLSWVKLGHATSAEIERLADTLEASDIVEVRASDPGDASFRAIRFDGKPQWVRFAPGMDKAAAFLETRRYAGAAGGTLAFSKMEGVTLNAKDRVAYLAMSYIYKSMADGKSGIKVAPIHAGAVYELALGSDWMPSRMRALPALVGRDLAQQDAAGNRADPERVANPDNLKFSERLRTLFIGEDSGLHVNNFLWAYNVDSGKLARVLSCPVGAESTGLQAVDDLNGFAYVMSNYQHPGDWEKPLHDKVRVEVEPLIERSTRNRRSAAVGYIAGLPKPA